MNKAITIQIIYVLFTVPMLLSNIFDNKIKDKSAALMNKIFICVLLKLLSTILGLLTEGKADLAVLNTIFTAGEFGMGIPSLIYFSEYVEESISDKSYLPHKMMTIFRAYCLCILLLDIVSIFVPIVFSCENGIYKEGPLINVYNGLFVTAFLFLGAVIWRAKGGMTRRKFNFLLHYMLAPLIGALLQITVGKDFDFVNLGASLGVMIVYITVHMDRGRLLAEQEKKMTQMQVSIMLSQMQPHFLYNSLNSIYYLCRQEPLRAQKAIKDFSDYLRINMDSIKQKAPVPFNDELRHIEIYLSLEKMRFEEELNVVYDIRAKSFMLPALSVQPLVENAVKYGICRKEGGDTVKIMSRETESFFEVRVEDDGVGYDVNAIQYDGRTHIGIDNVKGRLEVMCGGSLEIKSTKGIGTTALIRIPKE